MSFDRLVGIIGTALGVIGIIISFFLARRGRERPEIRYLQDFDVVISPEDALLNRGLKMRFNDKDINTVSRTVFAVWNQRGSTLLGTDVVPEDKLRLQLSEDDTALRARLISYSRPQIKVNLATGAQHKNNQVIADFDFLDPGDGFIVEVIHPGPTKPSIEGTIRGARLTSNGNGKLTTTTLDYIGESSRKARVRNWIKHQTLPVLLPGIVGILAAITVTVVETVKYINAPRRGLVPPGGFDLTSTDGQLKYASAVNGANNYIGPVPVTYVIIFLAACTTLIFARQITQKTLRIIPKSIVKYRVTEEPDDEVLNKRPTEIGDPSEQSALSGSEDATSPEDGTYDFTSWRTAKTALKLKEGDRVEHDKYGFGIVRIVDGVGPRATATVDFGEKGNVRLMLIGSIPMRKVDE